MPNPALNPKHLATARWMLLEEAWPIPTVVGELSYLYGLSELQAKAVVVEVMTQFHLALALV